MEEEVLEEKAPPKKAKGGGGGTNVVGVIIIMLLGFAIVVFLVLGVKKLLGTKFQEMKDQSAPVASADPCNKKGQEIFDLTEGGKPLKFKLKDPGAYVLTKIALCLEPKGNPEELKTKIAPIKTLITKFFLEYSSDDIFGGGKLPDKTGKAQAGGNKADDFSGMDNSSAMGDEGADSPNDPAGKYEKITEELGVSLRKTFQDEFTLSTIYLYEFEVTIVPF